MHVIDGRRVPTQKPVNFMTRSQLDNLHHGQAVRKAVFGRVFTVQVTRETYCNLCVLCCQRYSVTRGSLFDFPAVSSSRPVQAVAVRQRTFNLNAITKQRKAIEITLQFPSVLCHRSVENMNF